MAGTPYDKSRRRLTATNRRKGDHWAIDYDQEQTVRNFRWFLLIGIGFPLFAQSSAIYKCANGPQIAYQNFPCAAGHETLLARGTGAVNQPAQEMKQPAVAPVARTGAAYTQEAHTHKNTHT